MATEVIFQLPENGFGVYVCIASSPIQRNNIIVIISSYRFAFPALAITSDPPLCQDSDGTPLETSDSVGYLTAYVATNFHVRVDAHV